MDLAKYRALFLEEATEHLAEMSRALLMLEKTCDDGSAIDEVFRMAHSIKGMAASLEMDAVTELSHALEDVMSTFRSAGRVDGVEGIPLLFMAHDSLERMVATVRESDGQPMPDPELVAQLAAALSAMTGAATTGPVSDGPAPVEPGAQADSGGPPKKV